MARRYTVPGGGLSATPDLDALPESLDLSGGQTLSATWEMVPGEDEWSGTDLAWSYNIPTNGADITHKLLIQRVQSDGVTVLDTLFESTSSAAGATGTRSGTYSISTPINANVGDILRFTVEATRGGSHGSQTIEIAQNGTSYTDEPWTAAAAIPEGGSVAVVEVAASGEGTKIASGGSESIVAIAATGGGEVFNGGGGGNLGRGKGLTKVTTALGILYSIG